MNRILVIEFFYIWGINFMGPFVSSHEMNYILVAVDCVSKWVEVIDFLTKKVKVLLHL